LQQEKQQAEFSQLQYQLYRKHSCR